MSDGFVGSVPPKRRIWEAGHYYQAKGPTEWSKVGWELVNRLTGIMDRLELHGAQEDARMLFIDDVHTLEEMHRDERDLDQIEFTFDPVPKHIVLESDMRAYAEDALRALMELPNKKRPRISNGVLRCSGYPLKAANGQMLCLLYDLGLTWHKRTLGFTQAVNVVAEFYEQEQRALLHLAKKIMPEFELRVVLHDLDGCHRYLT